MKHLLFSLSLFVLITFCLSTSQAAIVTDSLFAYWSFDSSTVKGDVVEDVAGANDATMKDGAQIVAGMVGDAIQFDGVDDHFDMDILEGFGPKLAAFTFELCLKTTVTADWTTLFKVLNDGCTTALGIDLNRTGNGGWAYAPVNSHFYLRSEDCLAVAPEIKVSIYDNKWHHIAWVMGDAANNSTVVYVDGKAVEATMAFETNPAEFADFMHPVYLGAGNNRGKIERFCPATVDEFRLYTKGLTAAEVAQNYQAVVNPTAVTPAAKLSAIWGEIKQR